MMFMNVLHKACLVFLCAQLAGCAASQGLTFPSAPLDRTPRELRYDMSGNGKADFALLTGADNRTDVLAYDTNEDGRYERTYRLSDYGPQQVPHLIILLDSIPYQCLLDFYREGHFSWFPPPQKVIAPFPTISSVIFNEILHGPPLRGTNNYFYDQSINGISNPFWEHLRGKKEPWQRYLHYDASYMTEGLGFVKTRAVFREEVAHIKQVLDASPDRTTIVYVVSASGMACRYGLQGIRECLQEVERLCLQLLWERQGALKISLTADHGHNLTASQFVSISDILNAAGFAVKEKIEADSDVVIDTEGLVAFAGLHTRRPAAVAAELLRHQFVELAFYQEGDRVLVRDAQGSAAIEMRRGKLRYLPLDRDVLSYRPVTAALVKSGTADPEGFAAPDDWFRETVDHAWPDAPPRIWDAFHGLVMCPSDVMVTLRDGYMSGLPLFRAFIDMQSSHGGLNQQNSATFLLTMTGRATCPLRSRDILKTIEPDYLPAVRTGR